MHIRGVPCKPSTYMHAQDAVGTAHTWECTSHAWKGHVCAPEVLRTPTSYEHPSGPERVSVHACRAKCARLCKGALHVRLQGVLCAPVGVLRAPARGAVCMLARGTRACPCKGALCVAARACLYSYKGSTCTLARGTAHRACSPGCSASCVLRYAHASLYAQHSASYSTLRSSYRGGNLPKVYKNASLRKKEGR